MADSEYKVNIVVTTTDKTSAPAKKAAKSIDGIKMAAKALGVVMAAGAAVKYAAELAKVGAAAQRQAASLDSLAAAAGESGDEISSAIREASDFTIDRMSAMEAANKAMVMDVAKSPAEFERLTKVAVALGRAMGQDATKSIDDFVTASARQSQMIADNLGLTVTVGQATERYADSLGIAVDELTDAQKKQAFLNMMLEEGEKKMLALGDGTLDSAGKIEQAQAAWQDTKTAIGSVVATLVDMSGALDTAASFAQDIAGTTEAIEKQGFTVEAWAKAVTVFVTSGDRSAALEEFRRQLNLTSEAYDHQSGEIERYASTLKQAAEIGRFNRAEVEQQTTSYTELAFVSDTVKDSLGDQVTSQGLMLHTILQATDAIEAETGAMDAFVGGMDAAAQLGLSMNFTRQLDSMQESAAQFATDREKIEAEHQEKVVALQAKGAARSVQINVGAEQEKLAKLGFSRDQAQLKIDEMTGKERQSAQNAKQQALITAQQRYDEQQTLLEDYSAGRLVTAGQNVTALIAEENRRKDAAIAALDEQMAKQQEVQDQAMGQMMLQAFDQWGAQKDIPVEKMIEMRTAIAEEYGLVSEGATELVTDMVGEWDVWAAGTKVSTDEVIKYMGAVIDETGEVRRNLLDLTASDYVIKVRWEQQMLPEGVIIDKPTVPPVGGCTEAQKRDKNSPCYEGEDAFTGASSFRVRGTNLDTISPPLGGNGGTVNNNSDTFIINDPRAMVAVQENRRRQARSGIARTM